MNVRHAAMLVVALFFMKPSGALAQRSLDIINLDILSISKDLPAKKITGVRLSSKGGESRISAEEDFKFVQVRNTGTYILVPAVYSAKTVDIRALISGQGTGGYLLDAKAFAYRMISADTKTGKPLDLIRCGKGCLKTASLVPSRWKAARLVHDEAIIIPRYRPG